MVVGEGKRRRITRWFWGADGGARAIFVMRGYGKSGEVVGGGSLNYGFGVQGLWLSFGLGGTHVKLKSYMFLESPGTLDVSIGTL